MDTRRCWQCHEPYYVNNNGRFQHRCADGRLIVVGTSYEDFDVVAELEDA